MTGIQSLLSKAFLPCRPRTGKTGLPNTPSLPSYSLCSVAETQTFLLLWLDYFYICFVPKFSRELTKSKVHSRQYLLNRILFSGSRMWNSCFRIYNFDISFSLCVCASEDSSWPLWGEAGSTHYSPGIKGLRAVILSSKGQIPLSYSKANYFTN